MKLKFLKSLAEKGVNKCTLNKDGRLGFSSAAVKQLNLQHFKYAKIALDEENRRNSDLYLFLTNEVDSETLKVYNAGGYFNLRTKPIFDELKIDYKSKKYIFDLKEVVFENNKIYKLEKRILTRKKRRTNKA